MNPLGHMIFNAFACLLLAVMAWPRLRRLGYTIYNEIDGAFYLIIGALIGGWAANAAPQLVAALTGSHVYDPWWMAGEHWMGLVAGGALTGYLWVRWRRLPVGASFDALAPLLPITLAIIRIGCYLNADSHGRVTDGWLAMYLPDPDGVYAMRYPTQLVSMGANLLLAGVLFGYEQATRRQGKPAGWPFPGFLFLLYVVLYCLGRIYFEFWRDDMYPWFGSLTYTHLYCFLGILMATWAIGRGLRRARRTASLV